MYFDTLQKYSLFEMMEHKMLEKQQQPKLTRGNCSDCRRAAAERISWRQLHGARGEAANRPIWEPLTGAQISFAPLTVCLHLSLCVSPSLCLRCAYVINFQIEHILHSWQTHNSPYAEVCTCVSAFPRVCLFPALSHTRRQSTDVAACNRQFAN